MSGDRGRAGGQGHPRRSGRRHYQSQKELRDHLAAFIACLEEVQDSLGELNDVVVGERLAREAAHGIRKAPHTFVAGRITGALKARVAPLMDRAEAALSAFAEAKPFWH